MTYQFGDFEVDVDAGRLTRCGHSVQIQDQPFQLLVLLVSQAGSVVTRETIRSHLWPGNTNVEYDKSLRVAISKLREVLGDDAAGPIYIETLPRRGYRFISRVVLCKPFSTQPDQATFPKIESAPSFAEVAAVYPRSSNETHAGSVKISRKPWVATAVTIAVLVAGVMYVTHERLHQAVDHPISASIAVRRTVAVIGLKNLTNSPEDRWLSTAIMGSDELARFEEATAVKLGVGLPREELLDMQGQLAILSHDWPRAIEIYRTLFTFYPDNAEFCIHLAYAQSAGADSKGALATLNSLQNAGIPSAGQGQIELTRINVNLQLGNYSQALAVADRAIQISEQLELKQLHARALWMKASALERMAKSEESLRASAESQALFREIGDKNGLALAEVISGDILYDTSRYAEARKSFLDCVALFRYVGNQSRAAIALERVGNTYFSEGSLSESRSYYDQALQIYRESGVVSLIANAIGNIADVEDVEGNLAEALKNDAEALAIFTKAKDMRGVSTNLVNTGHLELERGNLVAAANDYSRSEVIARQMSYPLLVANACLGHGDTLLAENDIAGSFGQYDLAAKAIEGKDLPDLHAQLQAARGTAEVISGNPKQAVADLQQAAEFAAKDHDHALAARVLAVLSRAQLELGRLPDAADTASRASTESDAHSGPEAKLLAGVAIARIKIAQGNVSAAQETIRPLLPIVQRDGYLPLAIELRILQAQTVLSAAERRRQLAALSTEAKAHGWRLLAAEARSARP